MRNLLYLLLLTLLTSCGSWSHLTFDKYTILRESDKLQSVKFKFKKEILLEMYRRDTVITSVDDRGVVKLCQTTRLIEPIPANQYVRLVESFPTYMIVELVDYDLQLYIIKPKHGTFGVGVDSKGQALGTNYIIKSDPELVFKLKKRRLTQNINLRK